MPLPAQDKMTRQGNRFNQSVFRDCIRVQAGRKLFDALVMQ